MREELKEGMRSSQGDPKVLFVLNVILSAGFAYIVLLLTDLIGLAEFTPGNFLVLTAILVILTMIVTLR